MNTIVNYMLVDPISNNVRRILTRAKALAMLEQAGHKEPERVLFWLDKGDTTGTEVSRDQGWLYRFGQEDRARAVAGVMLEALEAYQSQNTRRADAYRRLDNAYALANTEARDSDEKHRYGVAYRGIDGREVVMQVTNRNAMDAYFQACASLHHRMPVVEVFLYDEDVVATILQ